MNQKLALIFIVLVGSLARAWAEICKAKFDSITVVDKSFSVGYESWKNDVIPTLEYFVNNFEISPDNARLALMTYNDNLDVVASFTDSKSTNSVALLKAIDNLRRSYPEGSTNGFLAMNRIEQVEIPAHKKTRPGAPLFGIYITDGLDSDPKETLGIASRIKKNNPDFTLLCLGVGMYDREFMKQLCEDQALIFEAADFKQLIPVIEKISKKVCNIATSKPTQSATAKPTTAKPTTAKPTTAKPTTISPTTAKPTTISPTTAKPTATNPTTANPTASPTAASKDVDLSLLALLGLLVPAACCAKCIADKKHKGKNKKKPVAETDKSTIGGAHGAQGAKFYGEGLGTMAVVTGGVKGITLEGTKEQREAALKQHQDKLAEFKSQYVANTLLIPTGNAKKSDTKDSKTKSVQDIVESVISALNKGLCPGCGCKSRPSMAATKPGGKVSELKSKNRGKKPGN